MSFTKKKKKVSSKTDNGGFFSVSVWAAVDQGLSDRIADAVGHPHVKPMPCLPASEVINFRHNIGVTLQP